MEEAQTRQETQVGQGLGADLAWLALALVLTLALRLWMLEHTEVTARDSIGYIRYALEFEQLSWPEVLRKNHQHPGYPLAILAASYPVRAALGLTSAAMQLSAQLASTVAALLLIVPMFYLGKWAWDRSIGFWAAVLFQFLPVSAHHLSDGISEAWFLLWLMAAVWAAVWALQTSAAWRYGLCGLCGGLAYLTRPEGALVLVATALVLLGCQFVAAWRRPWRNFLSCGLSLSVVALATGSLYFGFTWRFTNKISVNCVLGQHTAQLPASADTDSGRQQQDRQPLWANLFAANIKKSDSLGQHLQRSLLALLMELVQSFQYLGWLPALLGLWWYRGLLWRFPGLWVMVVLCIMHTLILCLLAAKVGYVSDRHVILLVLCGCYPAVAALREMPQRFWLWYSGEAPAKLGRWRWQGALIVLLIGLSLPRTLQPLHANRAGHHAAGLWLAQRLQAGDLVKDDHCWAHYFAGMMFLEGKDMEPAPGHQPLCYHVISRSGHPEVQGNRTTQEAQLQNSQGKLVFHWPPQNSPELAKVVVYAVPQ